LLRIRTLHLSAILVASLVIVGSCVGISSAATRNGSLSPGDHTFTLEVQGIPRSFILHIPPGAPVAKRPLLLIYHGSRATAQGTIGVTDFEQESNKTGELVAFLQGVNNHWNEYAGVFGASGVNDVIYTVDVIKDIEARVSFDHARIVAAGFSNGALMAESLGCQLAKTFAMIVPVEGQLTTSMVKLCAPARPISMRFTALLTRRLHTAAAASCRSCRRQSRSPSGPPTTTARRRRQPLSQAAAW